MNKTTTPLLIYCHRRARRCLSANLAVCIYFKVHMDASYVGDIRKGEQWSVQERKLNKQGERTRDRRSNSTEYFCSLWSLFPFSSSRCLPSFIIIIIVQWMGIIHRSRRARVQVKCNLNTKKRRGRRRPRIRISKRERMNNRRDLSNKRRMTCIHTRGENSYTNDCIP